MEKQTYKLIEEYMNKCMVDAAHDKDHIYRVLYNALAIAKYEKDVNYDILITACLLHDIGRAEQFLDKKLCHAIVGAKKAYDFLIKNGYDEDFCNQVANCIKVHRFRSNNKVETIEQKILFDADKLDVTGTLGIARTILYNGHTNCPLYEIDELGNISDGSNDLRSTFLKEYKRKLEKLYSKFYTVQGMKIAEERRESAVMFYENMLKELNSTYKNGIYELEKKII